MSGLYPHSQQKKVDRMEGTAVAQNSEIGNPSHGSTIPPNKIPGQYPVPSLPDNLASLPSALESVLEPYIKSQVKNAITYEFDYYSGAQLYAYIGDIWLDEISFLEFTVLTPKHPIYGYNSKIYDAMADGRKIVQGSFTINFKEAAYLYLILKEYQKLNHLAFDPSLPQKAFTSGDVTQADLEEYLADRGEIFDGQISKRSIIDVLRKNSRYKNSKENLYPPGQGEDSAQAISQILGTQDDYAFESIAEVYEDLIWGATAGSTKSSGTSGYDEVGLSPIDELPPFDIILAFGDINNQLANHTVRKIMSVELAVGPAMAIKTDGEPIQEAYRFIARDFR